jgi:hypothetical protein
MWWQATELDQQALASTHRLVLELGCPGQLGAGHHPPLGEEFQHGEQAFRDLDLSSFHIDHAARQMQD